MHEYIGLMFCSEMYVEVMVEKVKSWRNVAADTNSILLAYKQALSRLCEREEPIPILTMQSIAAIV